MEWKAGDRAMVVVDKTSNYSGASVFLADVYQQPNCGVWVYDRVLHPLPAADPLTGLERAVVETVMNWAQGGIFCSITPEMRAAAVALRAARTPPDPVRELREAWKGLQQAGLNGLPADRLESAIAALEAREAGR